jgi:Domain of unknown function (DUF6458)
MGFGFSLFMIALGAILAFAVHVGTNGIDLHTVGWILMVVGAVGLVAGFIWTDTMTRPVLWRRRYPVTRAEDPYDYAP